MNKAYKHNFYAYKHASAVVPWGAKELVVY